MIRWYLYIYIYILNKIINERRIKWIMFKKRDENKSYIYMKQIRMFYYISK